MDAHQAKRGRESNLCALKINLAQLLRRRVSSDADLGERVQNTLTCFSTFAGIFRAVVYFTTNRGISRILATAVLFPHRWCTKLSIPADVDLTALFQEETSGGHRHVTYCGPSPVRRIDSRIEICIRRIELACPSIPLTYRHSATSPQRNQQTTHENCSTTYLWLDYDHADWPCCRARPKPRNATTQYRFLSCR